MNVNLNNTDNNDYARGYKDGKIAGATAEAERAQAVANVLEDAKWELLDLYRDKGDNGSPLTEKIDMILQQWKERKEVEPEPEGCPYCGSQTCTSDHK